MSNVAWYAEKLLFEVKLEEFLSRCPNMTPIDRRDLCKNRCELYDLYCISIEPSETPLRPLEETANE